MAFENLPDESRVWVYGFSKKLNSDETRLVENRLKEFVDSWTVHGSSVAGGYELLENQFVILATNDTVSGCSIDSSVTIFKDLKRIHGLDGLNQNLIFYRNSENEVQTVLRQEFQELVQDGKINTDTRVFNLLINSYDQVKEGLFESTFSNSWHCKVFKLAQQVVS